jgi:hypothetical protein
MKQEEELKGAISEEVRALVGLVSRFWNSLSTYC